MNHLNTTDRFEGAAHWAALSEEDRAAFGAAAFEAIAAEMGAECAVIAGRADWERPALAAYSRCSAQAQRIFALSVGADALTTPDEQPRIPSLLGMVCRACGCSEDDACAEGCGWAEDALCTACAPRAAAPAPAAGGAPCP